MLQLYNDHVPFQAACTVARCVIIVAEAIVDPTTARQIRVCVVRDLAHHWNLHHIPELAAMNYAAVDHAIMQTGTRVGGVECGPFAPIGPTTMLLALPTPGVAMGDTVIEWRPSTGAPLHTVRASALAAAGVAAPAQLPTGIRGALDGLPARTEALGWTLVNAPHQLPPARGVALPADLSATGARVGVRTHCGPGVRCECAHGAPLRPEPRRTPGDRPARDPARPPAIPPTCAGRHAVTPRLAN